jgi:hypothetical protein
MSEAGNVLREVIEVGFKLKAKIKQEREDFKSHIHTCPKCEPVQFLGDSSIDLCPEAIAMWNGLEQDEKNFLKLLNVLKQKRSEL